MADFCKQCSIATFGEDGKDFQFTAQAGYVTAVLCEGCGPTYVSNDGTCVCETCLEKHGVKPMDEKRLTVSFKYHNHRDEVEQRTITVDALEYVWQPGFNYQPGWFLSGFCHSRKARRSFALSNIVLPTGDKFKFYKLLVL